VVYHFGAAVGLCARRPELVGRKRGCPCADTPGDYGSPEAWGDNRREDFATIAAFEKARDEYYATERPKEEEAARSYPLRFEQDGSFQIDDVPTGNYELRIHVTEPRKDGEPAARRGPVKEIGSLTREVVVPEVAGGRSDKPLDLGLLQLQWTGKAAPRQ